jgi:superfamily II DNA or RNA helicase
VTVTLRPYQAEIETQIFEAWQRPNVRNIIAVAPTGAGKTAIMSSVVKRVQGPSVSIAHRQELVSQISIALARNGIYHNLIAPEPVRRFCIGRHIEELGKNYYHAKAPAHVAGVDTLIRRGKELAQLLPSVQMWNCDESHHLLPSNKWGKAAAMLPNAYGLGFTASPIRADRKPLGRALGGLFDHMVLGPSMRDLIRAGYLSEYRLIAPTLSIDRAKIPVSESTGELNQTELRKEAHRSQIVGDIVENYQKYAAGLRGIAFVVDIEQAVETAQRFVAAGVRAMAVSSKTPDLIRQDAIRRFSDGRLQVLVNVDLFGEGFDVPAVEVVMMGRPTESFGLYLQQFGRALRKFDGKDCIARGSMILTESGLKPIEDISLHDKVWDGCNFVHHGGAICKGVRNVIEYQGLVATPDHKVWTAEGWRTFGDCALEQIQIAKTGSGGIAIRECENLFTGSVLERHETAKNVRFNGMRHVRAKNGNNVHKSNRKKNVWLSKLQSANQISKVVLRSRSDTRTTVQQSKRFELPQLRVARDRVPFCISNRMCHLDTGQSGNSERPKFAVRPNRKRWALRTGKHSLVNLFAKQFPHSQKASYCCDAQISTRFPTHSVRGFNATQNVFPGHDTGRNREPVVNAVVQTEREVWDILDCGPFSRFTAQGLLVHNCGIIIDHVGNYIRHGLPDAARVWSLEQDLRGTPRGERDPDVLPMRRCSACFSAYEAITRTCPYCGHVEVPESRGGPEFVDGDLTELSPEFLAQLRGEVAAIETGSATLPYGVTDPRIIGAVQKNFRLRQEAQRELRDTINLWAGIETTVNDRTESQAYSVFYHRFGVDVLSAQKMPRADMVKLTEKIRECWT